MEFDVTILGIVIGMMVLANRLVAMLITPLWDKYGWDKFWLAYPAWILSGVFVWFTGVNLFASFIPNQLIGQILTAIVAGGGSNLLHDLTDKPGNLVAVFNALENDQLTAHDATERQDDKWIPVSERLPKDCELVWVRATNSPHNLPRRAFYTYRNEKWVNDEVDIDNVYSNLNVTHWMPLPVLSEVHE